MPWDHPRSRGVYPSDWQTWTMQDGSSPLARGLLTVTPRPAMSAGIIPARAGFTPRPPRRPLPDQGIIPARAGFTGRRRHGPLRRWDHPRSRGVYDPNDETFAHNSGSSPLARGLPHLTFRDVAILGIIPARAGFTREESEALRMSQDHPRSRGVYIDSLTTLAQNDGSSPLARGLLVNPGNDQ